MCMHPSVRAFVNCAHDVCVAWCLLINRDCRRAGEDMAGVIVGIHVAAVTHNAVREQTVAAGQWTEDISAFLDYRFNDWQSVTGFVLVLTLLVTGSRGSVTAARQEFPAKCTMSLLCTPKFKSPLGAVLR